VVHNVGSTDRVLRVLIGSLAAGAALLLRAHPYWAVLLVLAGVVLVAEGATGH
jgi:hypothetical protein